MIIVSNTYMINIFKKIPIFKLDLGTSLMSFKEEKVVIKDAFMMKYLNMTGRQVLTFGSIGKLIFYQDFSLSDKEFFIFNDETIYNLIYTDEDSRISPETYLASIVKKINEKEGIKENVDRLDIKKDPDIKLPAEQYIQEMIKKRREEYGK